MLGFWLRQFNAGSLICGLCLSSSAKFLFVCSNLMYVLEDRVGDICGLSFVGCWCQFEIGTLDKGFHDLSVSHFPLSQFGVSAWCLKCTKHMACNGVVQYVLEQKVGGLKK